MSMPVPIGWNTAVAGPTITYIGSASSASNASSYNFGSFTIPEDGLVVAVFCGYGETSRTVSSISIGGTNGNLVTGSSSTSKAAIGSRVVSSGSRNVTVTLSGTTGTVPMAMVAVYLLTGYVTSTPFASTTPAATVGSSTVISVNTPANGVAFYGAIRANNTINATWSSANNDVDVNANGGRAEFASVETASATPRSETVTWSSGTNTLRAIGASWE